MQITVKAKSHKIDKSLISGKPIYRRRLKYCAAVFLLCCQFSLLAFPAAICQEESNNSTNSSGPKYAPEIYEYLHQGSELLKKGNFPAAKAAFEKVLKINGRCFEAHNNIGLVYYRSGDMTQAASAYEKAIDINPTFLPSLCNLGVVRYKLKQFAEAEALYKMALRLTKGKDPKLHYSLGNVLRDQKRYDEALDEFKKAVEEDPDFAFAHNGLAGTYYCLDDLENAEKEGRLAIKLKPDYALAYYHLGLVHERKNDLKGALEAFNQSLKFETDPAYINDTKQKIVVMRKSLGLSEDVPKVDSSEAAVLKSLSDQIKNGKFVEAEWECRKTEKGSISNNPLFWNLFGLCLVQQGNSAKAQEAVEYFKKAIMLEEPGGAPLLHYNLAQALRLSGDLSAARFECEKAVDAAKKIGQTCPLAYNLQGIMLKQEGKLDASDHSFKMGIVQSSGKYPVIHYNRALLLEKMNKKSEAEREFKTYLKLSPKGANVANARLHLKK